MLGLELSACIGSHWHLGPDSDKTLLDTLTDASTLPTLELLTDDDLNTVLINWAVQLTEST